MVPPAGSYVSYNEYGYEGSAKANFSAGRPGHLPGTEWSLTGSVKAELDLAAHIVMAT